MRGSKIKKKSSVPIISHIPPCPQTVADMYVESSVFTVADNKLKSCALIGALSQKIIKPKLIANAMTMSRLC